MQTEPLILYPTFPFEQSRVRGRRDLVTTWKAAADVAAANASVERGRERDDVASALLCVLSGLALCLNKFK